MRPIRFCLAVLALLPALPVLTAAAYTCTDTDMSTGTPAPYIAPPTLAMTYAPDSRWVVTSSPAGFATAAAYDVPPAPGWYVPGAGEPDWVTATGSFGADDTAVGGAYEYATTFTKRPGIALNLHGVFAVDSAADIYVNGVPYLHYAPPAGNEAEAYATYSSGAKSFNFMSYDRPDLVRDGVNTLTFRVQNYTTSTEGLFFWGGTRSCS